jgi:hypothetical protein
VLGCLASLERASGAMLLLPALIMFFYGPRADAPPGRVRARWRPRYPFRGGVLWTALIPLGAAAVGGYWALRGFGLNAGVHAQEQYQNHQLTLPPIAVWHAITAAWNQLTLVIHGGWGALPDTNQAVFQLGALCVTGVLMVGVFRRLPIAYGIYSLTGLVALHLSAPTPSDPLAGFARYASLRFPLFMIAAAWAVEHRRSRVLVLISAIAMVAVTVQFSTWHVVGSLWL